MLIFTRGEGGLGNSLDASSGLRVWLDHDSGKIPQNEICPKLIWPAQPPVIAGFGDLEVLREDYIRTARRQGFLLEKVIINRHALKNSLKPSSESSSPS